MLLYLVVSIAMIHLPSSDC